MGPPALLMFLASLTAPLLARRVRPGVIVAVTLVLSTAGYLLLSVVDRGDIGLVVTGFGLVYLGLGATALAPPDLLRQAQDAFTTGLNVTTLVTGLGVLVLALVPATVLRHVGTIGDDR